MGKTSNPYNNVTKHTNKNINGVNLLKKLSQRINVQLIYF